MKLAQVRNPGVAALLTAGCSPLPNGLERQLRSCSTPSLLSSLVVERFQLILLVILRAQGEGSHPSRTLIVMDSDFYSVEQLADLRDKE